MLHTHAHTQMLQLWLAFRKNKNKKPFLCLPLDTTCRVISSTLSPPPHRALISKPLQFGLFSYYSRLSMTFKLPIQWTLFCPYLLDLSLICPLLTRLLSPPLAFVFPLLPVSLFLCSFFITHVLPTSKVEIKNWQPVDCI